MVLRIVVFLGVGLVLLGFGAAGWQYWQSLPQADAVVVVEEPEDESAAPPAEVAAAPSEDIVEPGQKWLISEGGGLVPRRDARAYLQQSKFVKDRTLVFRLRLPLTSLLSDGEALPADPYREAFAEVRAAVAAAGVCDSLQAAWVRDCALVSADLQDGSYDPESQTATFRVELAFTLKAGAEPLPDLGTRAFSKDVWEVQLPEKESPQKLLEAAIEDVAFACSQAAGCRVMSMNLTWESPKQANGTITFGALMPLPKGVFPAPPLF
jgi:hypothetical protein